jgi:hypothetical protein
MIGYRYEAERKEDQGGNAPEVFGFEGTATFARIILSAQPIAKRGKIFRSLLKRDQSIFAA